MFRFKEFLNNNPTLIIAEFANAFEGKKEIALEMIDRASESGVDALKFQIFFADELLVPEHPRYNGFKQLEMPRNDWLEVLGHASNAGKLIFIDVFGEESFEFSRSFDVDAYKIPPSDMTNDRLIEQVSSSGVSIILSAGASTLDDIGHAVGICKKNSLNDYAIMHGFQSYPTRLEDTNLNMIKKLEDTFNCPVGYADHVDGGSNMALLAPVLAVARGARLIEKHFTLERDLKGTDYQSSVNPDVLKEVVQFIRDAEIMFGSGDREQSLEEQKYKDDTRKRIVAKRDLRKNEILQDIDITFKRAPKGIFADEMETVLGRKLIKGIKKNSVLMEKDLK